MSQNILSHSDTDQLIKIHQHELKRSPKSMSLSTAKKALNFLLNSLSKNEVPLVSFYGGEPLLEFSLLKSIVELAVDIFAPQAVEFNLTTNGTIMDQQIAKFLIENNFHLLVSLDGPKNVHDRYRKTFNGKGSYKRAIETLTIIRELSSSYFNERVRVNIVLAPPLEIDTLNKYLKTETPVSVERCSVSLVEGSDTNFLKIHSYTSKDIRSLKILRRQAENCFITGRWENDPIARLLFKKPLLRIAFRNRSNTSCKSFIATGQCFPGGHKLFVDTKGFFHICERIDEGCPIGHVDEGINIAAIQESLGPFFNDALKTCADCYAQRLCGVCIESTLRKGRFNKLKKTKVCTEAKRQLHNNLISYVRILAENPVAFQNYTPLVSTKSFGKVLKI